MTSMYGVIKNNNNILYWSFESFALFLNPDRKCAQRFWFSPQHFGFWDSALFVVVTNVVVGEHLSCFQWPFVTQSSKPTQVFACFLIGSFPSIELFELLIDFRH